MSEGQHERELNIFGPEIVLGMIVAAIGDFATALLMLFVVGFFVHYIFAFFIYFLIVTCLRHFFPKLLMWIAIIVPLPLLSVGIILAVIAEKSAIARALEEQAAIIGVGAVTGGLGALVGEGAEVAAAGAEAVEVGTAAGEAAGGAAAAGGRAAGERAAQAGEKAARKFIEEGEEREEERQQKEEDEIPPEALGEEKPFFEQYREEMLGTPPEEEPRGDDGVIMKGDGTIDLSSR